MSSSDTRASLDTPTSYHVVGSRVTLQVAVHDGTGPRADPVVLIPGVMSDAATWAPTASAIAASAHAVHVLNRRGRAPSGPLGPDYGVEAEIGDVHALLDGLPGRKHLVGWSYGALAAMEAATTRDDLASLVAYEPISRPFAPDAAGPIRDALASGSPDRAVELINTQVSGFSPEYVETLRAGPAWDTLCRLARPLAEEQAAVNRFEPSFGAYAALSVPTTLIVGEHNLGDVEPYGPSFTRVRAAMPAASVVTLPGLGHLAHLDAPDLLAATVLGAIASGPPSTPVDG